MLNISIVPEEIFKIGNLPVTNSLFTSWIAVGLISLIAFFGMARARLVPRGVQLVLESIYSFFLNLCDNVLENKKLAEKTVPFITTIFLFVFVSNLFGLIPGVGSIGLFKKERVVISENTDAFETYQSIQTNKSPKTEFIPLFRAPSSDLNMTIALALIAVVSIQIVGFKTSGFGYLKKFFNFSNPINFFVGILELISEFAKIISFSFRLFGNIFAGEVLLAVMLMLVPYFVPVPFYGLELFVAVIQAFVFAMLTLVFIKLAMISHGEPGH